MHTIKKFLNNFSWWKVLLVLLPPLLFSWPLLPGFVPYPFKKEIKLQLVDPAISVTELPRGIQILGASEPLGSNPLLSILLRTKITTPMPVELCFNNYNKIFEREKEVDPQTLIDADEAGAMSFQIYYQNIDSHDEIYIKLGEKDRCRILPVGGAILENEIVLRKPLPLRVSASPQEDGVRLNVEPRNLYVLMYLTPGYYHIIWQWSVFFINFIVFFFAWLGVLSILNWVRKFLKKGD